MRIGEAPFPCEEGIVSSRFLWNRLESDDGGGGVFSPTTGERFVYKAPGANPNREGWVGSKPDGPLQDSGEWIPPPVPGTKKAQPPELLHRPKLPLPKPKKDPILSFTVVGWTDADADELEKQLDEFDRL